MNGQSSTSTTIVKGFEVRLSPLFGLGLVLCNFAGYRRVRVSSILVGDNGYCEIVCSRFFGLKRFRGRGRYNDATLKHLEGFREDHLRLVETARKGEAMLRQYLNRSYDHQIPWQFVNRLYRQFEKPVSAQGG
jgi:hypothetical protein